MLKTNCKAVKEKIKNYIIDSYNDYYENCTEQTEPKLETFKEISTFIIKAMLFSKGFTSSQVKSVYDFHKAVGRYYGSFQDMFIDWCQGLPNVLNCLYYYNVSAIDLLGDWLEETETERNRYTEDKACELISKLLYRDLIAQVRNIDNLIIEVLGL